MANTGVVSGPTEHSSVRDIGSHPQVGGHPRSLPHSRTRQVQLHAALVPTFPLETCDVCVPDVHEVALSAIRRLRIREQAKGLSPEALLHAWGEAS